MTFMKTGDEMSELDLQVIRRAEELPEGESLAGLADFFHETMRPWQDTRPDVVKALNYVFGAAPGQGGFLVLAREQGRRAGALLMLDLALGGFVADHLLLFVSVEPEQRGRGLGRRIIECALGQCPGTVKLHVDFENPAGRLYERLGFEKKYYEMRRKPS
jgi:[ribosomal protein S18]-alanine N-acetyltransferase